MADYWGADMGQGTCSVEECERPRRGREWCNLHYQRWRHTGDPLKVRKKGYAPKHVGCLIEGCDRPHAGRGWCGVHYQQWIRWGDPLGQPPQPRTKSERFWPRVDKNGPIARLRPELGTCWLWTGPLTQDGYGVFASEAGRTAHRFAYTDQVGPIPEGQELDHFACEVRHCVRPTHVRPASHYENIIRMGRVTAVAIGPCSRDGCSRDARKRGMCDTHYQNWRRVRARQATPRRSAAEMSEATGTALT